jgi:hypothetical protein
MTLPELKSYRAPSFTTIKFDIMNELGPGFLESVYRNALFISLKEKKSRLKNLSIFNSSNGCN